MTNQPDTVSASAPSPRGSRSVSGGSSAPLERVCFRLQLKLDRLDEYIQRHAEVWDDMLDALTETGWTNYSLFVDVSDGTLIGYFETPDLEAARAGMAAMPVNARWQASMAEFFEDLDGVAPDEGFRRLLQIFHLP
jgi:L-rhamnose mutarotase